MVASTGIKYFVHTNTNAPQLDNVQGSMITVLDACLVNGLTLGTVNSMTATGTTITVNFGSTHNLLRFQVVKITGAAQAEYNGEHRILSVPTTSSVTFEVATAPSASPATGTIVASLPSLGWSLPFTGTGKRAYKNTDAESPYLRVVDAVDPSYSETYAKYAKVGMVESMTSIDAMLGHQVPFDPTNPDKNWIGTGSGTMAINGWAKWIYASAIAETTNGAKTGTPTAVARTWVVVGNGEVFYIFNKAHHTVNEKHIAHGFGKLNNLSKINASAYFLACREDYSAASFATIFASSALTTTIATSDVFMYKGYKGDAVLSKTVSRVLAGVTQEYSGYAATFVSPDANIGVFSSEYILAEGGNIPRGVVQLLRWLHQAKPYSHLQAISENGNATIAVSCASHIYDGQILVDLGKL